MGKRVFDFFKIWGNMILVAITIYEFILPRIPQVTRNTYNLESLGWSWQTWLIILLLSILLTFIINNMIQKYEKKSGEDKGNESYTATESGGGNALAFRDNYGVINQGKAIQEQTKSDDEIRVSINPMPRESGKYVSIRVYNNHSANPVYCTGFMIRWEREIIDPKKGKSWLPIYDLQDPLSWDGGSKTSEIRIDHGDNRDLNVAKRNSAWTRNTSAQMIFTFTHDKPYPAAKYRVWIDIECKFGNITKTETFIGCVYMIDPIRSDELNIRRCSDAKDWEEEAKHR